MRISDWSSDVCSSDLATRGLYPPGSTLKPMAAIAAIEHGVDPSERHTCIGGYRLGNRFFRCLGTHGSLDMPSAIMKSCNSYFYWLAHRLGYDAMARSEEHTSELQSLMRISYAVFCFKKKTNTQQTQS